MPEPSPQHRVDTAQLEDLCRTLLVAIGEDPEREGLVDTPRRWAKWWKEFTAYDPGNTSTSFQSIAMDQLVVVGPMRVWSLCEHHILPFWADITIGYLTGDRVLGLSKFARIAHQYAHRLQVQERLVEQIAAEVKHLTGSPDVAVLACGEHLCMTMRGIKTPARMISSAMHGRFLHQDKTRAEFIAIATKWASQPS